MSCWVRGSCLILPPLLTRFKRFQQPLVDGSFWHVKPKSHQSVIDFGVKEPSNLIHHFPSISPPLSNLKSFPPFSLLSNSNLRFLLMLLVPSRWTFLPTSSSSLAMILHDETTQVQLKPRMSKLIISPLHFWCKAKFVEPNPFDRVCCKSCLVIYHVMPCLLLFSMFAYKLTFILLKMDFNIQILIKY